MSEASQAQLNRRERRRLARLAAGLPEFPKPAAAPHAPADAAPTSLFLSSLGDAEPAEPPPLPARAAKRPLLSEASAHAAPSSAGVRAAAEVARRAAVRRFKDMMQTRGKRLGQRERKRLLSELMREELEARNPMLAGRQTYKATIAPPPPPPPPQQQQQQQRGGPREREGEDDRVASGTDAEGAESEGDLSSDAPSKRARVTASGALTARPELLHPSWQAAIRMRSAWRVFAGKHTRLS
jgi:hypothetical protein